LSNVVQHQTNRSQACARSARRMLYVVAVGTLISTLNQAYKSSEVHVSTRMISGGRLLALTSSGIYISALQLRRSSAAHRAVPSRWKPLACSTNTRDTGVEARHSRRAYHRL